MTVQTLTIGKQRFVLLRERDFLQLQGRARSAQVRPEVVKKAMKDLQSFRRSGKAASWTKIKRELGL
jgi:hypothetical protein